MSPLNVGNKDAQVKKLSGVMIKAKSEEKAVKVTERARLPLAIKVKKLDTLPPGQQATSNIPKAIPGEGSNK